VSKVDGSFLKTIIRVDLTGVNLNNVPTVAIGIERSGSWSGGSGGSGVIFLDDIRFYGTAPAVSLLPDPEGNLTVNLSFEFPDWGPSWGIRDNDDNWREDLVKVIVEQTRSN